MGVFSDIQEAKKGRVGGYLQKGVRRSADFRRIERLPRRRWEEAEDLPELVELLTEHLRLPGGEMKLWPTQAAALRDVHDVRGLFGSIPVGEGKALVSLLAPLLLEAERPVLLVPAQLRDQTLNLVLPEMRKHWRLHPNLRVVGYSELSTIDNADILERLEPDCIIADECHALKLLTSARTRRVSRYMHEHPMTHFIALSGTITNRSIMDYHHLILWALKPDMSPLPSNWREASEWGLALDEGVPQPILPGALTRLCNEGETPREGYQRRLAETPGVISGNVKKLGTSLNIHRRKPALPEPVSLALRKLDDTWETPAGDLLTEAVAVWRHARELACGFFYRWDPQPPRDWLEARRDWKTHVRHVLTTNRRGLDTELQVWRECESDPARRVSAWDVWNLARDTFTPNPVPVWLSDYLLQDAAEWLEANPDGIAWVEHVTVGERLAEVSGRPYFGSGAQASVDIAKAEGAIIASIAAHGTGKNLQRWNRNLVLSAPPSGQVWEQLLGRTHRRGQLADEVEVEVYLHTARLIDGWRKAIADARYLQETLGNPQRLLYGNVTFDA